LKLQHIFSINHHSEIDQEQYNGVFTCKKLSVQDTARLGVRQTQLNGGMHFDEDKPGYGIDAQTNGLNHMIAVLELTLVNKPSWFNLDEIIDLEILSKVYHEVASFEAKFRRSNSKPGTTTVQDSPERSIPQEASTNGPRTLGKVVEHEVQTSLVP
jgi:hypothetical protein